jgi:hypothetical protein
MGKFAYRATIDWLVDAIPDAAARARIFGATPQALLQRRMTESTPGFAGGRDAYWA